MAEKKYWRLYTEHCIRHPKDHVSYGNFRWRVRTWGEKLAIRLGKQESVPELAKIHEEKRNGFLLQKRACERKAKKMLIAKILLGVLLFGLGILIGTTL